MTSLNFENHNNNGNPHSQYDIGKVFKFSNSSTDTKGYIKIASFLLANRLYSLPLELQPNVVKHLFFKFSLKEIGTAVSAVTDTISLDARVVSVDNKTQEKIAFQQFIKGVDSVENTQTRNVFIKRTSRTDLTDKDGIVPVNFDIYVSLSPKATIALIPESFIIEEQTVDSVIPIGAIRSDVSTLLQRYEALLSNYQSQIALAEGDAKSISGNQKIIYPTINFLGEETTVIIDNFDFNIKEIIIGKKSVYVANKVTCLNSPFDNTTEYFVESRTVSSDWINQTATNIDGVVRSRNNKAGVWSDWKEMNE